MNAFPDIKIEVQSHTDVRASDAYNYKLSERRVKATAAHLVSQGIDKSRITGKGYGETRLVNDCTTPKSCQEQKHEQNRRSEFIVVE